MNPRGDRRDEDSARGGRRDDGRNAAGDRTSSQTNRSGGTRRARTEGAPPTGAQQRNSAESDRRPNRATQHRNGATNGAGQARADDQRSRGGKGEGRGRHHDERRESTRQRGTASRAERSADQRKARPGSAAKNDARQGTRGAGRVLRAEHAELPRSVARDVLRAVRERDAYANLVLPTLLRERGLSGRDAALATELAYGACRSLGLLDAVIAAGAGRPIEEIDGPLLDVLRLGVYQLLRTRIGAHAAVDTSVALARAEFGTGKAGFVNAVLRRAAERTTEQWIDALAPDDPVGRSAFEYAHPAWIAQAFADALGARAGELREVLAADDARPLVHLVARPGDITAEELALVTGGAEGRWSPYAVYLDGGDPGKLEPVREKMAAVQDEGSQLVALALTRAVLDGQDNGRWLDLCAGPGGKAALLGAIAAIDGFRVDAVEPAEHRAELVRKAVRDLPVDVHVADGRASGLSPGYDRILVDAPCTGLGALRRRPEARWRRTPADVRDLVVLQRELLTAAWDLLRPGGVVVYSTCSPHLAETVSIVADAARRLGAEQMDTRDLLPGVTDVGDGPGAQLWPHRHGTDAMFLAALRKPR
ncbi:transcription antitermination factor NusB [Nocardia sp. NPDC049220]|uniref:transcription antitermination factor NusB n=1 Tax=Nocardia sp. NPDC049220 TaxID=3155273 RepID=UPI0033FE688C